MATTTNDNNENAQEEVAVSNHGVADSQSPEQAQRQQQQQADAPEKTTANSSQNEYIASFARGAKDPTLKQQQQQQQQQQPHSQGVRRKQQQRSHPLVNLVLPVHHSYPLQDLIDNTRLLYVAMRLKRSRISIRVRPEVLSSCPEILEELDDDVLQCQSLLPRSVHALIRRTKLWINHSFVYGPKQTPIVMNHSTAHHHEGWLLCARDNPDKALGIEIYNCSDFRRMRLHWNGCGLLLHEYTHLCHQHALGLDYKPVIAWFHHAHQSGLYLETLRRDWAGHAVETDLHYAMVDCKEFFAELSVTYLAFGYPHLKNQAVASLHNRHKMTVTSCSPPLIEPIVLARLAAQQHARQHGHGDGYHEYATLLPPTPSPSSTNTSTTHTIQNLFYNNNKKNDSPNHHHHHHQHANKHHHSHRMQQTQQHLLYCPTPPLPRPASGWGWGWLQPRHQQQQQPRRLVYPHCNKFYPFTRGQFQQHDPVLYNAFHHVWSNVIAHWKDPQEEDDDEDHLEDATHRLEEEECCWFLPPLWAFGIGRRRRQAKMTAC